MDEDSNKNLDKHVYVNFVMDLSEGDFNHSKYGKVNFIHLSCHS